MDRQPIYSDPKYWFLTASLLAAFVYTTFWLHPITGYDDAGSYPDADYIYGYPAHFFIAWQDRTEFHADRLFINLLCLALGLTGWTFFYRQASITDRIRLALANALFLVNLIVLAGVGFASMYAVTFVAMFYLGLIVATGAIMVIFFSLRSAYRWVRGE